MTLAQIMANQTTVGTVADGFWGPKSIAACKRYLRSLMPSPSPWPATSQAALQKFYGSPGDESMLVNLPVSDLGIRYDGQRVATIRCHADVADSLGRILRRIVASPHSAILTRYAGCFNYRPMTGGTLPSLHARGAAIDLDPDTNGFHDAWPVKATMPLEVMAFFATEGWTAAGAFWGYDPMHFQATAI